MKKGLDSVKQNRPISEGNEQGEPLIASTESKQCPDSSYLKFSFCKYILIYKWHEMSNVLPCLVTPPLSSFNCLNIAAMILNPYLSICKSCLMFEGFSS